MYVYSHSFLIIFCKNKICFRIFESVMHKEVYRLHADNLGLDLTLFTCLLIRDITKHLILSLGLSLSMLNLNIITYPAVPM